MLRDRRQSVTRLHRAAGAGVLFAALPLAACGEAPFAERDPKGYEACSEWAAYKSQGDATSVLGGGMAVAEIARGASTKEIRDSVDNLFDEDAVEQTGQQFGLLDSKALEKACTDEGFEFDD